MPKTRTVVVAAGTVVSFAALAAGIIVLARMQIIGVELAMLSLVALVGLYVGFGLLIAIYRLVRRMEGPQNPR